MSTEVEATGVGFGRTAQAGYEELLQRTEQALQAEGFGILCRIDVKATLKEKIGADMPPYIILGACNPPFAHKALTAEPAVGLMMPCNVVVRQVAADKTRVEVINANMMGQMFPGAGLEEVASEVTARLQKVLDVVVPEDQA